MTDEGGSQTMYAFLYDYKVTPNAFEIRLFGRLLLLRIKKEKIVNAHTVKGWFISTVGNHPFNTLALGNRLKWTYVLIERKGWPRFIGITPADPDGFVQMLLQR